MSLASPWSLMSSLPVKVMCETRPRRPSLRLMRLRTSIGAAARQAQCGRHLRICKRKAMHSIINDPFLRQMVDHPEVGTHVVHGQVLAGDVFPDVLHAIEKVGVSFSDGPPRSDEGDVVAEPAD